MNNQRLNIHKGYENMKKIISMNYQDLEKEIGKDVLTKAVFEFSAIAVSNEYVFCDLEDSKKIKDIDIYYMIHLACNKFDSKDSFLDIVKKYSNKDVNDDFDVEDIVTSTIKSDSSLEKKLSSELKLAKSEFMHDSSNSEGIKNSNELKSLDDKINDTTLLDNNFNVDLGSRDTAFVYVRNEIITGNSKETHSDLLNRYFHNHKLDKKKIRSIDSVDDLHSDEPVAFGHISDNVAYIEIYENCSPDEVKNALQKYHGYKKIYIYDYSDQNVTRVAKH